MEPEQQDADEPQTEVEFAQEKAAALAMLRGVAWGERTADESLGEFEDADATLVYFIFKWIKKYYHRDHEDYALVRARLSDLTSQYRQLTRKAKDGEDDPVVEWFEGSYKYRELEDTEFIDIVIDKLEG